MKIIKIITAFLAASLSVFAHAADVLNQRNIGLDLANEIVFSSIEACRERGYQVASVIVDRAGNVRSAMRDDLAARQTLEIGERKANMTIMSGVATGGFRESREDIRQELNHIDGLIVMQGGVPILAGGTMVGAIGISGAPGGDIDEACAVEAIEKAQDRLDFAD